jgi:hypothetical protein
MGSRIEFINPNAKSSCGCGESCKNDTYFYLYNKVLKHLVVLNLNKYLSYLLHL